MANRIVQAVYDLKDNITGKLKSINEALRGNRTESSKTADAVERNNKRASDSYKKTADSLGGLRNAIVALGAFVGLAKVKQGIEAIIETGERVGDLEKEFGAVFGSVEKGAKVLEDVRKIAAGVPQGFEDVAAAAIAMRKAGLDPLDGSLQALLDNQNAVNQSQEELISTIEALGKANVRGEANLRTFVSLTEQGIPVFELLGKAMGVSEERVRQLAESGKLGKDSIKLLIDELGKMREGVAADELGDVDAQIQKLKDSATELLNTIATSGALDFFREELKALNAQVAEAARNGRLQEVAKSISDGIVATGRAIKGVVGLVAEYSGALIALAKTYLIFKTINFAGTVLQGAQAMLVAGKAAKAAALEAGVATGTFGRMGAAIKGIPRNVQIFIAAAAIEFTLNAILNLKENIENLQEAEAELKEKQDALAEGAEKLAQKIQRAKSEYKAFSDIQIASAEQIRSATAEQLQAYQTQLEGAKKYYIALQNEARNAGDAAGLKEARTSVMLLTLAVAAVNAQLTLTSTVGAKAASGLSEGAAIFAQRLGEVRDDAKATNETVAKIFEDFDLSKPSQEVGDFALGFDAVAAKGGKASDTLQSTLLATLKKLSGEDLLNFQKSATAAMAEVGGAGAQTSAILKATLETALDRLGVKAEETGQTTTKAGGEMIAAFKAVAENVQASALAITAAFDAALSGVKTKEEAEALGVALQAAMNAGRLGAEATESAMRRLQDRVRSIKAETDPLADSFSALGIKSKAALDAAAAAARTAFDAIVNGAREGTAAQEDVIAAFNAYAEAQRAAAANSTEATKAQLERQLELQAAAVGIASAFERAGKAGKDAGDQAAASFANLREEVDQTADSVDRLGKSTADAAIAQDRIGQSATASAAAFGGVVALTNDQVHAMRLLNDELNRNGNLTNVSLETARTILNSIGGLIGAHAQVLTDRIRELEDAARQAQQTADRMADEARSLQDQIDQLRGNEGDIEKRRHEQKLADLKAEAEATGQLGTAAYNELVKLENELHQLKMRNLREQGQSGGRPGGGSAGGGGGAPSGAPDATTTADDFAPAPGGGGRNQPQRPLQVVANVIMLSGDDKARRQLAGLLARDIDREITTLQRNRQ